jgi:hypothetical protein
MDGSSSTGNNGRQRALLRRWCPPTPGCVGAAPHARIALPPPWPPPAPPPRGPLLPSSLCVATAATASATGGGSSIGRWLHRSLRRATLLAPPPVCCSMVYARARLPWRSSRRPDDGDEETRRAVWFVVHVASVCPTCFGCLTRMLQGFCADVAKVDLDFSTLRMLITQHKRLIPDVATVYFRMLWMLQLLLTYFLCCKH